jgi:hypothetical protein
MRGIDYLLTRPSVDAARIVVTGNSGGGTQTFLVMLADPRIAAAAPATFIPAREIYMWTGQPQDAEQNWFGYTAAGFDHQDILLAMAPKPVCVLAVTSDFFPIEGTRPPSRARRAWDLWQRSDALQLVEDQTIHTYSPVLARAAARFFARHLLQRDIDVATSTHAQAGGGVVRDRVRPGARRTGGRRVCVRSQPGTVERRGIGPAHVVGQRSKGPRHRLAPRTGVPRTRGDGAEPAEN